jgi:hypothetical protein
VNTLCRRTSRACIAALAVLALVPAAATAQFTCPPLQYLVPRAPLSLEENPGTLALFQDQTSWCAVGLMPDAAALWDLALYAGDAPWPTCFLGDLGTASAYDSVSFFVGDFNTGANIITYGRPIQQFGGNARAEWDPGSGTLSYEQLLGTTLNRPSFLRVWDLPVFYGGTTHYIVFRPFFVTGTLYVFHNPGGAAGFFATPDQALLRIRSEDFPPRSAWFAHVIPFVPPAPGKYAVVFARDNDVDDQVFAGYGYCPAPVLVSSGMAYSLPFGVDRIAFDHADTTWATVGVRGSSDDWEITLLRTNGGPYPECLSDAITKSSQAVSRVEFVVGDFHRTAPGRFFAFATDRDLLPPGATQGLLEFDGGPDVLKVNGNAALRGTDANDVLESWDVYLEAGRTYDIEFTHVPGVDARVFLFGTRSPGYFAHRGARLLESSGWAVYTAPHTGWYGVVVTNETGGTGTYTLRVSTEIVATDASSPGVTRLAGVAPNPSRGETAIHFDLAQPGRAELEILDLRGRLVARLHAAEPGRGTHTERWDGRDARGVPVPAGMYVVRLRVDGVDLGDRKLIRLAP